MFAIDKKKKFIKEYLRPEFKKRGFCTIKNHWYKVLDDGVLIVKLQNDSWGNNALGSSFALEVCFGEKDTSKEEIPREFNKQHGLQKRFYSTELLPYKGFLDSRVNGAIFYPFYSDEDIMNPGLSYMDQAEDLQMHFNNEFFNILDVICDLSAFQDILNECSNKEDRTMKILRFCSIISSEHGAYMAFDMVEREHFTEEEILLHMDWLKILCERNKTDYESKKKMAFDMIGGKYIMKNVDGVMMLRHKN